MKIGFLFNHDALHQVRHTAPVIAELARNPGVLVTVLASSPAQESEVRRLIGAAAADTRFVQLTIGRVARLLDAGLSSVLPFRRIAVLRENVAAFADLDVLVVPETTSLMLRHRCGLDRLKLVWIPHGAGDRSIGFRQEIRGFDLVLLSGAKVRDRMLAQGLVTRSNHAVVGYPKFDTVSPTRSPLPFATARPIVLYNPHFDPLLSSWYDWGEDIVRWFADDGRFNLIVAPHVMLGQRRWHGSVEHRRVRRRRDLPTTLLSAPNILLDAGSERSVDMTYTRSADLYLGDASSQVYEWLIEPRPAIFLNPHSLDWRDDPNFTHWRLGDVIDHLAALPTAIERAFAEPDRCREPQLQAFADTFSFTDRTAAQRAAAAIVEHFTGPDRTS